jgi:preprotein translocase subunit Sec61beta
MAENPIQIPTGFGGIVRYKEEFDSKLKISPIAVIGFIIAIIVFVLFLRIFLPISG